LLLLDSSLVPAHRRPLVMPLKARLTAANAAATLLDALRLQTPLSRTALTLVEQQRPGGLDAQMRSEIRSAAAEPGIAAALLTEYVVYRELASELSALRADRPLAAARRMVVTAHMGWRTRRWRAQQIQLAKSLGAEHVTIAPAGHLVMIEKPVCTADLIRTIARRR
jgi:hypothetical protein